MTNPASTIANFPAFSHTDEPVPAEVRDECPESRGLVCIEEGPSCLEEVGVCGVCEGTCDILILPDNSEPCKACGGTGEWRA